MPSRARDARGALLAGALALSLLMPGAGYAGEWTSGARLNSRAMTSFCALPPDKSEAFWLMLRTPWTS